MSSISRESALRVSASSSTTRICAGHRIASSGTEQITLAQARVSTLSVRQRTNSVPMIGIRGNGKTQATTRGCVRRRTDLASSRRRCYLFTVALILPFFICPASSAHDRSALPRWLQGPLGPRPMRRLHGSGQVPGNGCRANPDRLQEVRTFDGRPRAGHDRCGSSPRCYWRNADHAERYLPPLCFEGGEPLTMGIAIRVPRGWPFGGDCDASQASFPCGSTLGVGALSGVRRGRPVFCS